MSTRKQENGCLIQSSRLTSNAIYDVYANGINFLWDYTMLARRDGEQLCMDKLSYC